MINFPARLGLSAILVLILGLSACAPAGLPTTPTAAPPALSQTILPGFTYADGTRPLSFPADFGAHPDFRSEWWYYTGNLQTAQGRHFGFELTVFRVSLLPPTAPLPSDSNWYSRELYFAHFTISDISSGRFYAFERYSRPGPGLAGAQGDPYRVWLEDWNITGGAPGAYHLQAKQADAALDLNLNDEMGVILQGQNGYSRKGQNVSDASYYYSQPRLSARGSINLAGVSYQVSGLAWNDHEFSTSVLDKTQIGWDWFSLQFESGPALMLFQLRERDGSTSATSGGTFITADKTRQVLQNKDSQITGLDQWHSPHNNGVYPSGWQIQLTSPDCLLQVRPWMPDQEVNFLAVTYWEGAVRFEGTCGGQPVRGSGYIELTGYAGNLPLP